MKKAAVAALFAIMLVVLSMFVSIARSADSNNSEPSLYSVTQLGATYVVEPIQGDVSVVCFYDYSSDSGHTPYMEDLVSKVYLYRETESGDLSLVMHHSVDDSVSEYMRVDFDLEGVPEGAYTAVSDDPQHGWNESRPYGREFDLTLEPEGNWEHYYNSDGGVIGGLQDKTWSITINPYFKAGIEAWEYQTAEDVIELDMGQPIIISTDVNNISPDPDVGLSIKEKITSSGLVIVTKSMTGPPLPRMIGPYYDIQVTFSFTGAVWLSIFYDDTGLSKCRERRLRLWQYEFIPGDANLDGRIDWRDVCAILKAWGTRPDYPRWDPNCDINGDGIVDMKDLCIVFRNYGRRLWRDITIGLNTESNIIIGEPSHFSIFGVR